MQKLIVTPDIKSYLIAKEPLLGRIIEICGDIEISLSTDVFSSLSNAIIGQQLSGKVADVIWSRVVKLLDGEINPSKMLEIPDDEFRAIGVSYSKIKYLKCLSESVISGILPEDDFRSMDDEDIISKLTTVKGIGRWTAEMFLIFSLGREDVFSSGDGGLQRAVRDLYGLEAVPATNELIAISERWKPYRTYASLYLWKSLGIKPVVSDT